MLAVADYEVDCPHAESPGFDSPVSFLWNPVFLHWSWFLVAVFEISNHSRRYSSLMWNVLEYLTLFLIVTLHEFGHALACRQVGGTANQIVLWPLGGVAYVNPPQRPGATLWSIVAGPLVNVVLLPVLFVLGTLSRRLGWAESVPDVHALLRAVWFMNVGLLIFNLLPIYPLDGGQILRSLLWFVMGRGRSLMVAASIGLAGIAGFIILALWLHSVWFAMLAAFMLMNCWGGLRQAQALLRFAKLPRGDGFVCPHCKASQPLGNLWKCGHCGQAFDTFETEAQCPHCEALFAATQCLDCGALRPLSEWPVSGLVATKV